MGQKLCKLTVDVNRRWRGGIDGGNLVEQIGEPHEIGLVRHPCSPNGVINNLITNGNFLGQCLFAIVHQSSAHMEIIVKGIIKVKSKQCLALSAKRRLVFQ